MGLWQDFDGSFVRYCFFLSREELCSLRKYIFEEWTHFSNKTKIGIDIDRESYCEIATKHEIESRYCEKIRIINWLFTHMNIPINQWMDTFQIWQYAIAFHEKDKEKKAYEYKSYFKFVENENSRKINLMLIKEMFPSIDLSTTIAFRKQKRFLFKHLPKLTYSAS
jgi:hypothetical protein